MPNTKVRTYKHLKAKTPEALEALLRKWQAETGQAYNCQYYFDGEYHVAWFFGDLDLELQVIEKPTSVINSGKRDDS